MTRARVVATPAGPLRLVATTAGLQRLEWLTGAPSPPAGATPSLLLDRAQAALTAYFADPARPLPCLPLAPVAATAFRWRVWRAMAAIPAGEVRTYGELAAGLGTSPRAVGNAAGANPWPILVPCHRVVASGGLGGYLGATAGTGPAIKGWLLAHEGHPVGLGG